MAIKNVFKKCIRICICIYVSVKIHHPHPFKILNKTLMNNTWMTISTRFIG